MPIFRPVRTGKRLEPGIYSRGRQLCLKQPYTKSTGSFLIGGGQASPLAPRWLRPWAIKKTLTVRFIVRSSIFCSSSKRTTTSVQLFFLFKYVYFILFHNDQSRKGRVAGVGSCEGQVAQCTCGCSSLWTAFTGCCIAETTRSALHLHTGVSGRSARVSRGRNTRIGGQRGVLQ